jgi:hypothetical protein
MAVVAPIPSAKVRTTVAANPGEDRSCRKECFKSLTIYFNLRRLIVKGSNVLPSTPDAMIGSFLRDWHKAVNAGFVRN